MGVDSIAWYGTSFRHILQDQRYLELINDLLQCCYMLSPSYALPILSLDKHPTTLKEGASNEIIFN